MQVFNRGSFQLTQTSIEPCRLLFATVVVNYDNQAISKKSCNVASFSFDGAACLEACWCYCRWVGHVIREPCDFLCPGCMPSMGTVILSAVASLFVLLPLCIIFWGTLCCGIINSGRFLFIALSQSSDI